MLKQVTKRKKGIFMVLMLVAVMSLMAVACYSSTASSDAFSALVTKLQNWSENGLGKTFALAALLVGLGIGIVRQSVMGAATGLGISAGAYYGPTVLTGVFSATLAAGHSLSSLSPLLGF